MAPPEHEYHGQAEIRLPPIERASIRQGDAETDLVRGHIPEIIIEEDSPVGDEEREKFLKRIEGNEIAPTIESQAQDHGITVVTVPIHNSTEVMPHIRNMELDLIVFGGTRIIRGNIGLP